MNRAVFLDRDGTLIHEVGYLDRLDRIEFFPWSIDAVRLLNRAGFKVVVVTNQAGVARGFFDESFLADAHRHIDERLRAGHAIVDGFYYCPHHPEGRVERYRVACECRKPKAGMARAAAEALDLDLARSFVVGDRWGDLQMAHAAGSKGILVRTGYGQTEEQNPVEGVRPDLVADHLMDAVSWILRKRS